MTDRLTYADVLAREQKRPAIDREIDGWSGAGLFMLGWALYFYTGRSPHCRTGEIIQEPVTERMIISGDSHLAVAVENFRHAAHLADQKLND